MRIAFANGKYIFRLRRTTMNSRSRHRNEIRGKRKWKEKGEKWEVPDNGQLNVPRSVHASTYGLARCTWSVNRRRSFFFRRANHAWPLRGCSFFRNRLSSSACGGIFVRTTWTSASNICTVQYVFSNTELSFLVSIGRMRENFTRNIKKWGKMYNLPVTRVRKRKEEKGRRGFGRFRTQRRGVSFCSMHGKL